MAEELSREINILEIHADMSYAGGPRNMFTFSKFFNEKKGIFKVYAATYSSNLRGVRGYYKYFDKYKEIDIKTIKGDGEAEPILKFIAENKINVIHIHRSGGALNTETKILQSAKKMNPNIIIIEKNVFGLYDNKNNNIIDGSFFQSKMHLLEKYLPKAKTAFDFDRHHVLYNMVDASDFEKYRLTEEQIKEKRKHYDIKDNEIVLGRIGRPDLAKWSDLVFYMAPYLVKLVPHFKFILMGVPVSRHERIRKNPLLAKHFLILNPNPNEQQVHTFYQMIDILCHSSKIGECNGNTINEAMFWKKPVITNSTPEKDNGQLEQIDHMVNGIIANHPKIFAGAVAYLAKNEDIRNKMGEAAHERILKFNSPEKIAPQVEKFIIEKLNQKNLLENKVLLDQYNKIEYQPSKKEIEDYMDEYKKIVKVEFELNKLTFGDNINDLFLNFKQLNTQIEDYFEHKWNGLVSKIKNNRFFRRFFSK